MIKPFLGPSFSDSYMDGYGKVRRGVRPAGPPQKTHRLRQRPRGFSNGSSPAATAEWVVSAAVRGYLGVSERDGCRWDDHRKIAAARRGAHPCGRRYQEIQSLNV